MIDTQECSNWERVGVRPPIQSAERGRGRGMEGGMEGGREKERERGGGREGGREGEFIWL